MASRWFWGAPANPGEMRFHTGTLLTKDGGEGRKHFNRHEIVGLYGVQIGRSFVGLVRVGRWGFSTVGDASRAALEKGE